MLVCAVLAALASGVLMAYAICLAFFGVFRMRALPIETAPASAAAVVTPQVVQG
jgi:hypothetical protein